jgi:hypothetical protein
MHIKQTASYKMSKQLKRSLCQIVDPQERAKQKRIMIQAELAASQVVRTVKTDRLPQKMFPDSVTPS